MTYTTDSVVLDATLLATVTTDVREAIADAAKTGKRQLGTMHVTLMDGRIVDVTWEVKIRGQEMKDYPLPLPASEKELWVP